MIGSGGFLPHDSGDGDFPSLAVSVGSVEKNMGGMGRRGKSREEWRNKEAEGKKRIRKEEEERERRRRGESKNIKEKRKI